MECDFSGYATRNDLKCSDGRVIRKDAFKDNDGKKVPLLWNHDRSDPRSVLGHGILENREDGVYVRGYFNDSETGQAAKLLVKHGDVFGLSIYANHLKQNGNNVMHGLIREVSLVHAGANPGAYIDAVMEHSEEEGDAFIASYICEQPIGFDADEDISHAESDDEKGDEKMAEPEKKTGDEETAEDVFNTLTDKQKTVVYALIGAALEGQEKEDDKKMSHNVFENDNEYADGYISHSDQKTIIADAKKMGSFRAALDAYASDVLQHDDDDTAEVSGFDDTSLGYLFPEYKDVRGGMPDLITYDQGWVTKIMNGVNKTPFSRIRTRQVDIRAIDTLKAKGYQKGKKKALTGNYSEARRTTDPQTIYVRSALNRDDIVDMTDFDYVAYQYKIDSLQLKEMLATAIMVGDSRDDDAEDKIFPTHIRPIWTDDELFAIHGDIDVEAMTEELQGSDASQYFGENFIWSEAIIQKLTYLREQYKGSGRLTCFCDPHLVNVMLLARDRNGRRIYNTKAELQAALNVQGIDEVEQFANLTRSVTVGGVVKTKKLLAILVDLSDYNVGATKGGEITHFTQFDIDYNQEKSLLETRCSGALTRIKSAIVLEQDVTENP